MSSYNIDLRLVERLRNLPSFYTTIYPGEPNIRFSTKLSKNTPGQMSVVHTFFVPTAQYVIINPIDKHHFIKFFPRTKDNLNIIDGRMEVRHVIGGRDQLVEIYTGPTGEVICRDGTVLLSGDSIQVRYLHNTLSFDEVNSILEIGVEVKNENG